jgi:hypothetical protein
MLSLPLLGELELVIKSLSKLLATLLIECFSYPRKGFGGNILLLYELGSSRESGYR